MKRKMSFLVAGLLCLSLCLGAEAAGTVTDTLTVRVGYYGMEQDRYVEVATYHWSELYDALPLHYEAYSFFRSTDDGTYNTVIDSAYGFYLADLLDYAGIYSGDISVVAFYTRDQSVGFFTSFTYADLFGTQRYYYNDLSAHISPVYDENGTLTGYDGDEAWNDCWTVQPMLALEDSWVSYEIGTEHTAPNYSRSERATASACCSASPIRSSAARTRVQNIRTRCSSPCRARRRSRRSRRSWTARSARIRRHFKFPSASRPCAMRWRSIWTSPRPTAPFWRSPASPSRRTRSIPTLRP